MIGLDTNVLVRYIVQDDPEQGRAAGELIESQCTAQVPGYVSVPVLLELVWVLAGHYDYDNSVVASVVRQILRTADSRSRITMSLASLCGNSSQATPTLPIV